jgi:hypothetical protein
MYWIGNDYKLIKLLRNLINLHSTNGNGYKVHLINNSNINEYIKDLPSYFYDLLPANQADYLRVSVICDKGGMWLDSDTLVIDSLDSLFDIVNRMDGFFIMENNKILWNGIFASKPNTPLMIEWKKRLIHTLESKKQNIAWSEIGCLMLESLKKENPDYYKNYTIFNGLDNLYPVNWDKCVNEFINKDYDNYKIIERPFQPLIVLVNSVYKNMESLSEKEIINGKLPLHYFINKSFENLKKVHIDYDLLK